MPLPITKNQSVETWRKYLPAQLVEAASARSDRLAQLNEMFGLLASLQADEEMMLATAIQMLDLQDCEHTKALLEKHAGLSPLLDGLQASTQVWSIWAQSEGHKNSEGLRRLLLAIIRDLRVVPLLLSGLLVDLRFLVQSKDPERQQKARLARDIHVPLANRLGIWQLKWEMEDLAFRILDPETYQKIADMLDERRSDREKFLEDVREIIEVAVKEAGVEAKIAARPKHIYSIWKKMTRKGVPFSELYDVRAVRVLVKDIPACYAVLGVIHQLWIPIAAEFDDYIAHPKGNNYRSLHTAVVGPEGKTLEVQIRTHEMHEHSELGVAAHWRYKEGSGHQADLSFQKKVNWMRQLLDRDETSEDQLLDRFSTELIEDRVYLLTPKGEVFDLPKGATVLDFAYHVHTEVGHRCIGAKVNGRIVPLTYQPKSGNQIEILTNKTPQPRRDWLMPGSSFLATGRARDKVRAWFHKLDRARNISDGKEILEKELRRTNLLQADLDLVLSKLNCSTIEELHVALALGDVGPNQVSRALHEALRVDDNAKVSTISHTAPKSLPQRKTVQGVSVEGIGNLLTQIARCCQPVPGDSVVGYLTKGRGVSIHRDTCKSFLRLSERWPERVIDVDWGNGKQKDYSVAIIIHAADRKYLIKDFSTLLAQQNVHLESISSKVLKHNRGVELHAVIRVVDYGVLSMVLTRISELEGVTDAFRV